ncbi:unnamed protein product [Amoebophrya sp. A25]|nr:unnamed protein product [Amoebophrya sp. A25]|eukprot:GSA25T00018043001.1
MPGQGGGASSSGSSPTGGNGGSSSQQQFYCAVCQTPLDDALILLCNHNLCLNCAGKNLYNKTYDPASGKNVKLTCTICRTATTVDAESAAHLIQAYYDDSGGASTGVGGSGTTTMGGATSSSAKPYVYRNAEGEALLEEDVGEEPAMPFSDTRKSDVSNPVRTSSRPSRRSSTKGQDAPLAGGGDVEDDGGGAPLGDSRVRSGIASVTSFCPSHPEEPLHYFCLDCECKCICSECVIHGAHKGHEVLSVTKAYPLLQSKVSSLNVEMRERVAELNSISQGWERKQREMLQVQEQMKQKLTESFAEIRKTLQTKEVEMKKMMTEGLRDGLNFAETKQNEVRESTQRMKDAQKAMQHNTSHASVSMQSAIDALNWYAEARLSLNQLLVTDLPVPTESSKPKEWLEKYADDAISRVSALHNKVQLLH